MGEAPAPPKVIPPPPPIPPAAPPAPNPILAAAKFARAAAAADIRYIGSCCGSVQAHVRAMAKALGKRSTVEREWRSTSGKAMSAYEYYGHDETEA